MNWTAFSAQLMTMLEPLLLLLVMYASARATQWLTGRIKNERLKALIDQVGMAVTDVVKEIAQTTAADYREAAKDGVISPEEKHDLKVRASNRIRTIVGDRAQAELRSLIGSDALEAMISSKIEAQLHDMKLDEAAVIFGARAALTVPPPAVPPMIVVADVEAAVAAERTKTPDPGV